MPLTPEMGGQPERIGIRKLSALVQKRLVEQCVEWECAPTEGRLGAELFEHELLNRVIEHSPAGANTGLARSVPDSMRCRFAERTLCIGLCQTIGYARVSRHDQAVEAGVIGCEQSVVATVF